MIVHTLTMFAAMFCGGSAAFEFWMAMQPSTVNPALDFVFGGVATACVFINLVNLARVH